MVNNWHQQHAPKLLSAKAGKKPLFCDSEVLTLAVAQHWIGLPQEREFLRFIRSNHQLLFPRLVDQSQFNWRLILLRITRLPLGAAGGRQSPLIAWLDRGESDDE